MTKTALLLGSYGQSNLGDDLLMWNYLELLSKRGYSTIYTNVAELDLVPDVIKKSYPNLIYLPTYETSISKYIQLIHKADSIVYGGGTLYKELYASTGRSKYSVISRMMAFNMLAKLLGAKVHHLHIGIGSLQTPLGRMISRQALHSATSTIFRDVRSYAYAKDKLKIAPDKIAQSTDGLFLNPIWQQSWNEASIPLPKKGEGRVIGVNIVADVPDWIDSKAYRETIRQFVIKRLEEGSHVLFIPFQHDFNKNNDAAFIRQTFADILPKYKNYTLPDQIPLDQMSSYLRQLDVFIGMRLHSLLLATANHVPFLALAYDTKCWRFVQENSYPHALELERLTPARLETHFQNTLQKRHQAASRLQSISNENYNRAGKALEQIPL